jgi:hypothetical protein
MSIEMYTKIPDEQIKRTKREKNTYSKTSRLEKAFFLKTEGIQLHHNHEKKLFLTALLLFT